MKGSDFAVIAIGAVVLLLVLNPDALKEWLEKFKGNGNGEPTPDPEPPGPAGPLLSAKIDPPGSGKVEGIGTIALGQYVTLKAVPSAGWYFDYWEWDVGGTFTDNPVVVHLTREVYLIAHFRKIGIA